MCGITGFVDYGSTGGEAAGRALDAMCDSLAHRGPDAEGQLVEENGRIALGHRRLSIIDLSPAGAQPMTSESGRYSIVYNGEIYGFLALHEELRTLGHRFRGGSDTEVLLAAVEEWGLEAGLERLNGMFAFALLDREARRLVLVRDRVGKKPLYYGMAGETLAFGSELKALRAHPAFRRPAIDRETLALYARYGFVPGPRSIYAGVGKLQAGCLVELSLDRRPAGPLGVPRPYYDLAGMASAGARAPFGDEAVGLRTLEAELRRATEERMVADVPTGAFLSGGIDSSLVTALMQEVGGAQVRSYCIRFAEEGTNEAEFAAAVAAHLGTRHTELTATPGMALEMLDEVPETFDEPFADPSQLPTLAVSKLTRGDVGVALTGDGGDETFGGYWRYPRMLAIERLARRMPPWAARLVGASPEPVLWAAVGVGGRVVPGGMGASLSADRLKKLAEVLRRPDFRGRYDAFHSLFAEPGRVLAGAAGGGAPYRDLALPEGLDRAGQMMLLDTLVYLVEDVLVKVDRASMAYGLEVRSPLLDRRVIETGWRLPGSLRFDGTTGKVALRRLLATRVPEALFERPKQGFGIPVNEWLRGPLKARAEELLSRETTLAVGAFDPAVLARMWREHLAGRRNWGPHLWAVMGYVLWHRRWMGS